MKSNLAYDRDDLWEKDRRHTVHGWTDYSKFVQDGPEILVEGDGVYVTDINGHRLMDAMGGVWCVNVGYGRTEIVEAIATQARRLPFANPFRATTSPPAAQLSAKLAELAPGDLDHVLYSGGGSTANDTALRIVQRYFNTIGRLDKKDVICRRDAYHGSTSASASLGGIDAIKAGFDVPEAGVHYVSAPYAYRRADGADAGAFCDQLVDEFSDLVEEVGAERIACFFAEPVMGMGGVLIPPPGYFKRISEICKANDILIVADEVVTGFGRLGEFLASDAIFEMSPDIISCAKGLTSGYLPLGATVISSRIMEVLRAPVANSTTFTHGFTYAEHPVCCAAALANIDLIEREGLCRHVRETSAYFKANLQTLLDFEIVGDVRGAGFMFAIAINCLGKATTLEVNRIVSRWAGLRSYVSDHSLVIGPDAELEDFYWVAGQGGYGIQTSPAVARTIAALATGGDVPDDLRVLGLKRSEIDPARLQGARCDGS